MLSTLNSLKKQYPHINWDNLFNAYINGDNRDTLAHKANCSVPIVRKVLSVLNLRFDRHSRLSDYNKLQNRIREESENFDVVSEIEHKLEILLNENHTLRKQIVRARDTANALRKDIRIEARSEDFEEKVLKILNDNIEHYVQYIPKFEFVQKTEGNAFCILSDTHFGEIANPEETGGEYNYAVAQKALAKYAESICEFKEDTLDVFMIGDIISGAIHNSPIEEGLVNSLLKAEQMLFHFFETLSTNFKTITVHFVEGNHSRLTEKPAINNKYADYEYLLVKFLQSKLHKINFNISKNGYVFADIGGTTILACHGDRTRRLSPDNEAEITNLQNISFRLFGKYFTNMFMGHIHKAMIINNIYGGVNISNGSLNGVGDYISAVGIVGQPPVQICGNIVDGNINAKIIRF